MNLKKYFFAYCVGCLAAISVGRIITMSGVQTTIDAWFLTLTVVGQDVGDRMAMLVRVILHEKTFQALEGMSYLIGHSILEEVIKFVAFYIVFWIVRPTSIRQIVLMGMSVGVGFASVESFVFYDAAIFHMLLGFLVRAAGHGLFTGIITLLFGKGYFLQMRWIDDGAKEGLTSWFVRYEERIMQFLWAFFGLLCAAVVHSVVNIFAALGGQSVAILCMMLGWVIFMVFLLRPESGKQYGTIIREVDLLRQIVEAEQDLESLEKTRKTQVLPIKVTENKILKILKRFAKT